MVKLTDSTVYIRTKCAVETVKKLNLWGCDIDDISICEKMCSLEVLSLSVNRVESLESLSKCHKLVELYLRKNNIQNLSELEHLKDCKNLKVLWIDDNPCTQLGEYRHKVLKILPHLNKLDDKPVTIEDHLEPQSDDSAAESDVMHHSINSARSSRSGNTLLGNDMMTRSLYGGRTIIDTVMQPQFVHYGDTSDEDKPVQIRDMREHGNMRASRQNIMSQSIYGTMPEDREEDWGDFSLDETEYHRPVSMDAIAPRMCTSMSEVFCDRPAPTRVSAQPGYGRSVSVPRRRYTSRGPSKSPARDYRLTKIMSAVSVLLDELDQEGLREVIDEAQSRMKKQR